MIKVELTEVSKLAVAQWYPRELASSPFAFLVLGSAQDL